VNIMGGAGVHHFVTIGDYAYLGGAIADSPRCPAVREGGRRRQSSRAVNSVGLERAGFSKLEIEELELVCRKLFYHRRPLARAMEEFETLNGLSPHVKKLVEFLHRRSQGIHGRYREGLRPRA
jgi:UDP-N-acetylglucosamine acyltransferase